MSNGPESCINCGMCKSVCPILVGEKSETASPRVRMIFVRENFETELVFRCNLCEACKTHCPVGIDIPKAIVEARSQRQTEKNKLMIANIREFGNPFGEPGSVVEDLYCC
ncbi:hypothetical protein COT72_02505 [archaeon CG10_big_fil_rev_8_21_14_0_10_43_11]|nr:MAG: hypothetical protein COT72_02505 [archaeon CG10_big_fil_rev_8_21_14_0_10_43_11]